MKSHNRSALHLGDIVVLALVFFGQASFSSTLSFVQLLQAGQAAPEQLHFGDADNWSIIAAELLALGVAALYLRWRRFDWRLLDFSLNRRTLPLAALLMASAGLTADVLHFLHQMALPAAEGGALAANSAALHDTAAAQEGGRFGPLLLATALLNGFYEELFFMGLVFAVPRNQLSRAVALSLLVRFAFHTYQGLASALVITSLGAVFLLFRLRIGTLAPFMLAHAVFDIFGLSLLRILWWQ